MKNIALKKEKYSDNKQGNITVSTKITNFIKFLTNFYFKNFYKTKPLEKTRGLSTLWDDKLSSQLHTKFYWFYDSISH